MNNIINRRRIIKEVSNDAYAPGMVFQLDCYDGITYNNNIPTKWTDLIGDREFNLINVTQDPITKGLVFDGTAKGTVNNVTIPWQPGSGTIEAVFTIEGNSYNAPILSNSLSGYYIMHVAVGTSGTIQDRVYICPRLGASAAANRRYTALLPGKYTDENFPHFSTVYVSNTAYNVSDDDYEGITLFNGTYMSEYASNCVTRTNYSKVGIGYKATSKGEVYHVGKIYAIRIYNRRLSSKEQISNYQLDKKRFKI